MPAIANWPGVIQPGPTQELMSTLDILPTFLNLANGTVETVIHGVDQTELFLNNGKGSRNSLLYYYTDDPEIGPYALRNGSLKAHFYTKGFMLGYLN